MNKVINDLLNELEDTGSIKKLIPALLSLKKHINAQQDKLDRIEGMIFSDKPMSYRLALTKEILKEEDNALSTKD
jgi:hypothetical protein